MAPVDQLADRLKPDLLLYLLLESLDKQEMEAVKDTGHILCGESLISHLSARLAVDGEPLAHNSVRQAFGGQPVKQVYHVVRSTILPIRGLRERDEYLLIRAHKRKDRQRRDGAA